LVQVEHPVVVDTTQHLTDLLLLLVAVQVHQVVQVAEQVGAVNINGVQSHLV
jgi:hypothetical protein